MEDGALAASNILLTIHALGLGGCWVDPSAREATVKQMLGIPIGDKLICLIPVGYAEETPTKRRKELTDIVFSHRVLK